LRELQEQSFREGQESLRAELAANRAAIEALAARLDTAPANGLEGVVGRLQASLDQLVSRVDAGFARLDSVREEMEDVLDRAEERDREGMERDVRLAGELTGLAGSLGRLVNHLEGLGDLIGGLLDRVATGPAPASTPAEPSEPSFLPGGEGVSLILIAVPGFQALMEIQKALTALEPVAGVSVERFQEGDSRLLLHLSAPLRASQVIDALHTATSHVYVIEESRPELSHLRLKIVPRS
jgi:hypothetical protein